MPNDDKDRRIFHVASLGRACIRTCWQMSLNVFNIRRGALPINVAVLMNGGRINQRAFAGGIVNFNGND